MNSRTPLRWLVRGAALALATVAASPAGGETRTVTVFTAASLADAIADVARQFERSHPGARVRLNVAGSHQLAAQVELGAAADVFVAADERWAAILHARGQLAAPPVSFARNHLVAIVPRANPAGIRRLEDLARPGTRLVLGAEAVPVGRYAREALQRLSGPGGLGAGYAARVLANVVSEEENVKAVVAKVRLGEADAGVCYRSDVTPAVAREVTVLRLPERANVPTTCFIGIIKNAPQPVMARQFAAAVLGPQGKRALSRHGFSPAAGGTREPDGRPPPALARLLRAGLQGAGGRRDGSAARLSRAAAARGPRAGRSRRGVGAAARAGDSRSAAPEPVVRPRRHRRDRRARHSRRVAARDAFVSRQAAGRDARGPAHGPAPTVAGLALLLAFGRMGLAGRALEVFGFSLPFTTAGVIVAQVFMAAPFYVAAARAGFTGVDRRLLEAAATLGASESTAFFRVALPLARPALLAGLAMSGARALGEFGATITFAGNMPGTTQTLPLAVYVALQSDLDTAVVLSVLLMAMSFLLLLALRSAPSGYPWNRSDARTAGPQANR